MPTTSLDIDLSSERDATLDTEGPPAWEGAAEVTVQEVVVTGVRLGVLDWFVLALRLWIATIAATAVVSPLLLALGLGLYALLRVGWAALGA